MISPLFAPFAIDTTPRTPEVNDLVVAEFAGQTIGGVLLQMDADWAYIRVNGLDTKAPFWGQVIGTNPATVRRAA